MDVTEAENLTRDFAKYSVRRQSLQASSGAASGSSLLWIASALLGAILVGSLVLAFA
ncbi:hypothetical protein [Rhizobium sp. RU36D]|uniref:hypothetical protein n=1 Tax=Rhizobium sp. RU36D TaxID=1907415 RepID=UPI0009D7B0C3|nr:hypothetical protein [Rhizobium sp. RU36D]SMD01591.1 hypothetical protein SAMN05880593_11559 [Rhizobium sp. RU36D]